jgi:hypothetical protein
LYKRDSKKFKGRGSSEVRNAIQGMDKARYVPVWHYNDDEITDILEAVNVPQLGNECWTTGTEQ